MGTKLNTTSCLQFIYPHPIHPWVFKASQTKFFGAAPLVALLACNAAALSVFHVSTFAPQNEAAE